MSCHEHQAEIREEAEAERQIEPEDAPREPAAKKRETAVRGALWASLTASHLLLFTDILLSPTNRFLTHADDFFKGLVCLDLLCITLFLAPESLLPPRFAGIWTLLIAAGFIILIGWEAVSLIP